MVRCLGNEPKPPSHSAEFEKWCESGRSGRPVQSHIGDEGTIMWANTDGTLCVRFDDGDERVLFQKEIGFVAAKPED